MPYFKKYDGKYMSADAIEDTKCPHCQKAITIAVSEWFQWIEKTKDLTTVSQEEFLHGAFSENE